MCRERSTHRIRLDSGQLFKKHISEYRTDMSDVIKKVLLIFPPVFNDYAKTQMNPVPPLGLAYIAAVLELRRLSGGNIGLLY